MIELQPFKALRLKHSYDVLKLSNMHFKFIANDTSAYPSVKKCYYFLRNVLNAFLFKLTNMLYIIPDLDIFTF